MTKYIIHNFIHLVKNFFRSLLLTQRFVLITFIDYSIIAPLCLPLFYNFLKKVYGRGFGPCCPVVFPPLPVISSAVEKSPAELFPVVVILNRPMTNRKPVAYSFLPLYYTIVPCRTGNFSQTVSCRYDSQSFHAGQETIRKQFPAAVIRNRSMPDRKLLCKQFPAVMNHIRVPPDILIPPWILRFSGPAEYPP